MAMSWSMYIFLWLNTFGAACASQWPPVQQSLQDMLPNIELSLAPPQHPWPQVAAELGNLEESREQIENANMDRLQREMNKALLEARRQIGDTIGRAMRAFDDPRMAGAVQISRRAQKSASMLQQLPQDTLGSSALAVKVNVLPANPPDGSLRPAIDNIESVRSSEEKDMFDSAVGEPSALTAFIVSELEAQIQAHIDRIATAGTLVSKQGVPVFLEGRAEQLPLQANVRVVPTDTNYPTVASMVQGMEARRDIAENLARRRILEKDLDFMMACNHAVEEGMGAAIARIMAQYKIVSKSLRDIA